MEIDVKIYIKEKDRKPFLGKGPVELLENIEKTGSIKKASDNMNMSYSKAHYMVVKLEEKFGQKILKKFIGGKTGGGSVLTNFAKKLIKDYRRLERDIKEYASKKFDGMREYER